MKRFVLLFIMYSVLVLVVGCSKAGSDNGESEEIELMISAAASLTDALTEIKSTYESQQENVTITYNFGSSGKLAKQIDQGAPSDIFLSASSKDMNDMETKGLIFDSSRVDFTTNALVLITHKDSDLQILSFEDINTGKITNFAIGEPESVPVGRYTKEVFEHLGIWETLQNKLVMGSDVRQVLTHVEMGNADVGIVYSSDAFISDKVKVLAEADPSWHSPIVYPGAVVKNSKHEKEAQAFLDYLVSDDGKRILEKYGFK